MIAAARRGAGRGVGALGVAGLVLLAAGGAAADVRLPAVFGDSMVLQRETEAPIWGWADPDERVVVTASWTDDEVTTHADGHGRWRVMFPTPGAGGPHTVTIAGDNRIVLRDVLVGEVWLCSGQSNMEWPMRAVRDAASEIAAADVPDIRLFNVPNTISLHPRADIESSWSACTPASVRDFSAVGYFFGRRLHEALGVPIGLVEADWGGTRIEAWMSPEALGEFGVHGPELELLDALQDPNARQTVAARLEREWWGNADRRAPGGSRWMDPDVRQGWVEAAMPGSFGGEMAGHDGFFYMKRTVEIDEDWSDRDAVLELGPVDDMDDAWINGVRVGGIHEPGYWNQDRHYEIPRGTLKKGENVVCVRVLDTGGPGGPNGPAENFEIRLADDSDSVSLAGTWLAATGASMGDLPARASAQIGPNTATALYHGMIEPVSPLAIRGAIWYQGESNRGNAGMYAELMRSMIANWRDRFGRPSFPFYYVQIAPFRYGGDTGQTAALREAQREVLDVDNTGMVVTMDIGNFADIHPRNKQDVGARLAAWALHDTYGKKDVVPSGPLFESMKVDGSSIRVRFEHTDGGLEARGETLGGFEIAGRDGQFVAATARIDGDEVVVSATDVERPAAVRYLWDDAVEAELFNGAGLPASPFRAGGWE